MPFTLWYTNLLLQFEVAVEEKRRNVLSHPVMQTLIAQKWKFIQWVFYAYLAAYMVFLLSWTILISFPSVQNKHEYVFPRDIWRLIIAVRKDGHFLHLYFSEGQNKHYFPRQFCLVPDPCSTSL